MENAVDINLQESAPDDEGLVPAEQISSLLTETPQDDAQPAEEQTPQELDSGNQPKQSEPGWIKQRVNAAVSKAVAEAEARVAAKYEAMLSPLRESMMDREAEELVQSGEFKSLERAKEYVHLKNGMPTEQAPVQQQNLPPRDANGRFTSPDTNVDPAVKVRADMLAKQANKLKSAKGIDVIQLFNSDPEVKQRVVSGEWDFYDVAENAENSNRVPIPARASNGGGIPRMSIANMSEKQWEELNSNLERGRAYTSRKR